MSLLSSLAKLVGWEPLVMDLGSDFGQSQHGLAPAYDPENAMEAGTVFSWLYAVALRRATAYARLPIRVYRERRGRRDLLDDHWLYGLLAQPNSYTRGVVFRRDMSVDLNLAGNVFTLPLGPGNLPRIRVESLVRWHPERTSIVPGRAGPVAYEYDTRGGTALRVSPERMLHARQPSFRDTPDGLHYGVGMVEPLHTELEAEHHAVIRAKEQMSRGRPDVLLSPKGQRSWTKDQREAVSKRWEQLTRQGGGAITASDEAEVKILSWAMRDMEGQSLREYVRSGVLATGRTPPTLAGLEGANYAVAREEALLFWESIRDDAELLDACVWTPLLRLAGEEDTVAETDFGDVRALGEWRSNAATQAQTLYFMGVDRDVALEAVGLADVVSAQRQREQELRDQAKAKAASAPAAGDTPVQNTALNGAQISSLLLILEKVGVGLLDAQGATATILASFPALAPETVAAIVAGVQPAQAAAATGTDTDQAGGAQAAQEAPRAARRLARTRALALLRDARLARRARVRVTPLDLWMRGYRQARTEDEREAAWVAWQARTHDPAERNLSVVLANHLQLQAARLAVRLEQVLPREARAERAIDVEQLLLQLWDQVAEETLLEEVLRGPSRQAALQAYQEAVQAMALGTVDVAWEPALAAEQSLESLATQVQQISQTTREAVALVLEQGLADGASVGELQAQLQGAAAFGPSRALRIARTETTRTLADGAVRAYQDANAQVDGVRIRKEWLAERDGVTRPSHWALDGQVVDADAMFVVPAEGNGKAALAADVGQAAPGPGQFASPGLVVNCRCALLPVIEEIPA